MGAVMWLIAGVNFTLAFQSMPNHDWSHIIAGLVCLTAGLFV